MIKVKNVSKIYNSCGTDFYALNDVNITIETGSFTVILGPSGSGKSTLLNLIGGIDSVSCGNIFVDNQDITVLSSDDLASYRAEKIGFVFQDYNLIPTITVEENLGLLEEICKSTLNHESVLKQVGLENVTNKFPSQLSGGEQQRVAIARALIKNPQLLLCDEPTGALDTKSGAVVINLLSDCSRKAGKTVVVVTHNENIAEIADTVIRIKDGKLFSVENNRRIYS